MRKGEIRKRELLAAAERLFFSKGYAETTISDILESQGCSKGSFYHHFESKLQILSALCVEHASVSFERYQEKIKEIIDPLQKFDVLLYGTLTTTPEEEEMCFLLMPLISLPEGEEVLSALLNAQRALLLPEMKKVLEELKEKKLAFYPCPALPEVAWDAHMGLNRRLLLLGKDMKEADEKSRRAVQEALDAARYLLERTLDLPFGSVTIIKAPVLFDTLSRAARHMEDIKKEQPQ